MTTDMVKADVMEQVIVAGDLANLSAEQRTSYYLRVCESLGLNPATKPFEFLKLNNKVILYARREATEQLRKRDGVSVSIVSRELVNGAYVVSAKASMPDGRCDESIGAVTIEGLKGEALSNAMMKAETKAKRRVTLSICGLGFLDESEVPGEVVTPDGEIIRHDPPPQPKKELDVTNQDRLQEQIQRALGAIEAAKSREDMDSISARLAKADKAIQSAVMQAYTEKLQQVNGGGQ